MSATMTTSATLASFECTLCFNFAVMFFSTWCFLGVEGGCYIV